MKLLRLLLCFFVFSFSLMAQNSSDRSAVEHATKIIRPDELRAHIRFLADNLLAGRAPGTPGYDIAARYVATELEGMGLHPAASGGWFQPVPFEKAVTDEAASSLTLTINRKEQKLVDAKDYILSTWFARPRCDQKMAGDQVSHSAGQHGSANRLQRDGEGQCFEFYGGISDRRAGQSTGLE